MSFGKKEASSIIVSALALKSKKQLDNVEKPYKSNSNSSISDVYLNENNVTVHL